jgi:hypothetical protein
MAATKVLGRGTKAVYRATKGVVFDPAVGAECCCGCCQDPPDCILLTLTATSESLIEGDGGSESPITVRLYRDDASIPSGCTQQWREAAYSTEPSEYYDEMTFWLRCCDGTYTLTMETCQHDVMQTYEIPMTLVDCEPTFSLTATYTFEGPCTDDAAEYTITAVETLCCCPDAPLCLYFTLTATTSSYIEGWDGTDPCSVSTITGKISKAAAEDTTWTLVNGSIEEECYQEVDVSLECIDGHYVLHVVTCQHDTEQTYHIPLDIADDCDPFELTKDEYKFTGPCTDDEATYSVSIVEGEECVACCSESDGQPMWVELDGGTGTNDFADGLPVAWLMGSEVPTHPIDQQFQGENIYLLDSNPTYYISVRALLTCTDGEWAYEFTIDCLSPEPYSAGVSGPIFDDPTVVSGPATLVSCDPFVVEVTGLTITTDCLTTTDGTLTFTLTEP